MTKCEMYWKIIGEFKAGTRFVEFEGKKLTGFEGFRHWCGGKSYAQLRNDWNTYETLELLGKKLGIQPCEVMGKLLLSESTLKSLVSMRKYVGKNATAPDEVQEQIINKLIPKLLTRRIKPKEVREVVKKYQLKEKVRKKYAQVPVETTEVVEYDILSNVLKIMSLLPSPLVNTIPKPINALFLEIKDRCNAILDLVEK